MPDLTEELLIVNKLGLHARPAAAVVQRMLPFASEVYILFNGNRVNAKSIMGLLTLAATRGTRLTVTAKGDDAHDAIAALKALVASGFGED